MSKDLKNLFFIVKYLYVIMEKQNEILADNLTYYRKAAGFTQLEIAEKFNYSDKSISKWERGEGVPDIFILKSLADLYGITVDDFFNKEKQRTRTSKATKRWYIVGLSVALAWLVAATGFTVCMIAIPNVFPWWLFYIYAIAATGIIAVVFSATWKKNLYTLIATSIIIWGTALSAFLTVQMVHPMENTFLLFIVGLFVEVLAVIWFFLKRSKKKKERIEKEK